MASHTLPERLYQALAAIHSSQPRLIAAPPAVAGPGRHARGKRASVAISEVQETYCSWFSGADGTLQSCEYALRATSSDRQIQSTPPPPPQQLHPLYRTITSIHSGHNFPALAFHQQHQFIRNMEQRSRRLSLACRTSSPNLGCNPGPRKYSTSSERRE